MYRELHEETGLRPRHVQVMGRTLNWLRYDVPEQFLRRANRGQFRGQKQIGFLPGLIGQDCDICLHATDHAAFDGWNWTHYWASVEHVVEFKRDVCRMALAELSHFMMCPRPETRTFPA
jgi:putative (di)nucleoside polyphosphate hydrolase